MLDEKNFKPRQSLAGALEPGDATHYEMVAVEMWDTIEVVVLNDGFFDKITFLKSNRDCISTFRGEHTNPWTIKAARIVADALMEQMVAESKTIDFNINDYVLVKLTDVGRMELKRIYTDLNKNLNGIMGDYTPPVEDSEGWSRWQMWDLMNKLGSVMRYFVDPPFNTDIKIEVK
jgi:hypothetical protein